MCIFDELADFREKLRRTFGQFLPPVRPGCTPSRLVILLIGPFVVHFKFSLHVEKILLKRSRGSLSRRWNGHAFYGTRSSDRREQAPWAKVVARPHIGTAQVRLRELQRGSAVANRYPEGWFSYPLFSRGTRRFNSRAAYRLFLYSRIRETLR